MPANVLSGPTNKIACGVENWSSTYGYKHIRRQPLYTAHTAERSFGMGKQDCCFSRVDHYLGGIVLFAGDIGHTIAGVT